MRTVTAAVTSDLAAAVTRPGYLIEIAFAAAARFSTRGAITWSGQPWAPYDVRVAGLEADVTTANQGGTLVFGNADLAFSAFILAEGVSGRACRIWKITSDAPALADPILIFDGVCDGATIDDQGRAAITLQRTSSTIFCPRSYMTQAAGFSHLPVAGQVLHWGGETLTLTDGGL